MARPRLYLLRPGFETDGGGPFYCGACSVVEGMLSFFPPIRDAVDVHYIAFQRPRPAVVAELGEEHQGAPVLVLDERPDGAPDSIDFHQAHGRFFVDDEWQICNLLASQHAMPVPHVG